MSEEHQNILKELNERIRIGECSKHRTYFQQRISELEKRVNTLILILRKDILPILQKKLIITGDNYKKVEKGLVGDSRWVKRK